MKGRIVIGPDGKIGFFVSEGTFEQGKAKLLAVLAQLQAAGVNVSSMGQIEQHRHEHVAVQNGVEVDHGHEH